MQNTDLKCENYNHVFLDKKSKLMSNKKNINLSKIIDIIKNNPKSWDISYGDNDIYITIYKIKKYQNCKN